MSSKKKKKAKIIKMEPKMSLKKYIKLNARKLDVYETFTSGGIFESGKGHVVFTRVKRNGQKLVGVYLVDCRCLGVKDTFFLLLDDEEYIEFLNRFNMDPNYSISACDPNYASNIVYGALEYAEDLGIDPHKDFNVTEFILPDVEDVEHIDLEFGHNGIPHFISYATDNIGEITRRLNASVGKDGYNYTDGELAMDLESDLDYDETPEEIAESYFTDENDRQDYLAYNMLLHSIVVMLGFDIEIHKKAFIKNPENFLQHLNADFVSLLETQPDQSEEDITLLKHRLLSICEKFFIYDGMYFMTNEETIAAFNSEIKDHPLTIIYQIHLNEYGTKKISLLASIASIIINSYDQTSKGLAAVKMHYQYWENTGQLNAIEDEILEEIFELFEDHEYFWDDINFEKLDLSDIEFSHEN